MILYDYINGNISTVIYNDGTKIRTFTDYSIPKFPESIDIKITNYCDLSDICKYCHEKSNKKGIHADLNLLFDQIKVLPSGIELAIGGGNPLSHPNLEEFLYNCKNFGYITNLTVNQLHIKKYKNIIKNYIDKNLIYGLGISYRNDKSIDYIDFINYENCVIHVIAGIDNYKTIQNLISLGFQKFLVLGYKIFGNGDIYYEQNKEIIDTNLLEWKRNINKYIGKCILSFDNLAIEQLDIKRFFTDKGWNKFYMGNDFTYTMYIDAVNEEYSETSRSSNRISFYDYSLLEYFKLFKNN